MLQTIHLLGLKLHTQLK